MTRLQDFLKELIAVPSVNPAFLPSGDKYAGEGVIAEWLAHRANKAGLDVQWQPVEAQRANVFFHLRPRSTTRQRILLAPHLDTVGGDDVPGRLFTPREGGGRIYGRGACDTKGSIAIMFAAMCELARTAARPQHTEIVFVGLVDEESGQIGSRALANGKFKADLAIVGEPTRLKVVTAHKGALWLKMTTKGKAAHGARPELGRNAVHEMARIVDALETEYAAVLRRRRHPLLGRATVNVGSIRGGRQPNIVPDSCMITVDRRILPGETDDDTIQEIETLFRRRKVRAEIGRTHKGTCGPLETDPRLPLVRQFFRAVGQKTPAGVDFFSDGGILSAGGIPAVLFGPGDIAQAHTPDEWIESKQLERGKTLLLRFLQSLP